MQFSITCNQAEREQCCCVVVAVFANSRKLSNAANHINDISNGHIEQVLQSGAVDGQFGQTLLLYDTPNVASKLVLLINCEPDQCETASELSEHQFQELVRTMINALKDRKIESISCYLEELPVQSRDISWKLQHIVAITNKIVYRFDTFKSEQRITTPPTALQQINLAINATSGSDLEAASRAIKHAMATATGVTLAKDLANTPPNVCTPSYLADAARKIAKAASNVSVDILELKDLQNLGMNAMLSVTRGSAEPPKFIVLEYKGAKHNDAAPVVLVGKGITFDTGGISLKPANGMIGMKYDMCGAASVLGALQAAIELELPMNIVVIIAASENMPSGTATTPDSVVTSMNGITIEILNTDAEGRLVLCDALEYSKRFNPETIIDVATLTGACVVALGNHYSGMFSNDDALAQELLDAGNVSGDRCWRLPLGSAYHKQIKSKIADIANIGGAEAGSITAACFLENFVKDHVWAHLDVAGTAYRNGTEKFARGRPVPLLVQYLINKCDA